MSGDLYIDLETGILRNRLGISDAAKLAQAESELTSYRLIELRRTDLPGRYDLAHLQAFHRYIFEGGRLPVATVPCELYEIHPSRVRSL